MLFTLRKRRGHDKNIPSFKKKYLLNATQHWFILHLALIPPARCKRGWVQRLTKRLMMWYRRCQWCYLICCLVLQLTHFRPHLKYEPQPIILYQLPFLYCILLRYTPIYVHCFFENNNNSRSRIVLRISTNTHFRIAWCFTVNLNFFPYIQKTFQSTQFHFAVRRVCVLSVMYLIRNLLLQNVHCCQVGDSGF